MYMSIYYYFFTIRLYQLNVVGKLGFDGRYSNHSFMLLFFRSTLHIRFCWGFEGCTRRNRLVDNMVGTCFLYNLKAEFEFRLFRLTPTPMNMNDTWVTYSLPQQRLKCSLHDYSFSLEFYEDLCSDIRSVLEKEWGEIGNLNL